MPRQLYSKPKLIIFENGEKQIFREKEKHVEDIGDIAYTFKDGDTLTSLANRFYKDPLKWFLIADINDIENPLDIKTGTELIIPNQEKYNI